MSHSPNSKSLKPSELSVDNSDEYVPSDTTYSKRGNYKRGSATGDRSNEGVDAEIKKGHHASCHRCGNIRRHYIYCEKCPQVFCLKCKEKMIEEYGPDCFKNGCPFCKKLCCCSEKSLNCPRKYHCYKKCLTTKKGIKRNNYNANNAATPISSPSVHSQKSASLIQSPKVTSAPLSTEPILSQVQSHLQPQPQPQPQPRPVLPIQASVVPLNDNPLLQKRPSLSLYVTSPQPQPNFISQSPIPIYPSQQPVIPTPYPQLNPSLSSALSLSSRFSLSRMPSEGLYDPLYQSSLLNRDSLVYTDAYRWDPSMSQLQRAPDSVKAVPSTLYPATSSQPLILPLKKASSYNTSDLIRKPSLLSRTSANGPLYKDSRQDSINLWGIQPTPTTEIKVPSKELQSEVCFDEGSEENAIPVASAVPQVIPSVSHIDNVNQPFPAEPVVPNSMPWTGFEPLQPTNSTGPFLNPRGYSTDPNPLPF